MIIEVLVSITIYSLIYLLALKFAPVPIKKNDHGYEPLDRQNAINTVELYIILVHSNKINK